MLIGSSAVSVYTLQMTSFSCVSVCVCVHVQVPPRLSWIKNKNRPIPPPHEAAESISTDICVTIRQITQPHDPRPQTYDILDIHSYSTVFFLIDYLLLQHKVWIMLLLNNAPV